MRHGPLVSKPHCPSFRLSIVEPTSIQPLVVPGSSLTPSGFQLRWCTSRASVAGRATVEAEAAERDRRGPGLVARSQTSPDCVSRPSSGEIVLGLDAAAHTFDVACQQHQVHVTWRRVPRLRLRDQVDGRRPNAQLDEGVVPLPHDVLDGAPPQASSFWSVFGRPRSWCCRARHRRDRRPARPPARSARGSASRSGRRPRSARARGRARLLHGNADAGAGRRAGCRGAEEGLAAQERVRERGRVRVFAPGKCRPAWCLDRELLRLAEQKPSGDGTTGSPCSGKTEAGCGGRALAGLDASGEQQGQQAQTPARPHQRPTIFSGLPTRRTARAHVASARQPP